jgi:hypothetical protein
MEGQMERMNAATADKIGEGEKERALAKAALSVAELDSLLHPAPAEEAGGAAHGLEPIPLGQLDFVKAFAPKVDAARDTIIQEMEGMVINGLSDLNQPLLSSSLQTAHNLRLLPDLVSNLLADLNDAVTLRITRAFDSAAIGKEVAGKGELVGGTSMPAKADIADVQSTGAKFASRGRIATEPSSSNTQQWITVLWSRLERVIEDVANCCIKVSFYWPENEKHGAQLMRRRCILSRRCSS